MTSLAARHAWVAPVRPGAIPRARAVVWTVALLVVVVVVAIVLGFIRFVVCGERCAGAVSWS